MNESNGFAVLRNGQTIPRAQVAAIPFAAFRDGVITAVAAGQRVAALFGDAPDTSGSVDLYAVLADSARARFFR